MNIEWISVEDELPPQKWGVAVKCGKRIYPWAKYYRKKWWLWQFKLHQVTHWAYNPGYKPSIPPADLRAFARRCEKYKHQMQKKIFFVNVSPCIAGVPPIES